MSVRIIVGDVRERLAEPPDQSVHCCVTSPPYWGLRDYGVAGQLGLESTPAEYVEKMVAVFREVRRVLRDDGTLWLNLGDSYARMQEGNVPQSKNPDCPPPFMAGRVKNAGLKPKDLVGTPWRVAFALQADGWYLRQDIIWSKPNPMPESVRDRCTKAHEYIFLLSKSERYWFDADAIAEPADVKNFRDAPCARRDPPPGQSTDTGFLEGRYYETRNKRSVWTVATQPYAEAHFATFPPKLIEPCILAGCPVGGAVLDPFNGSGTTGLVSLQHGRHYVGIELNTDYLALTMPRIENAQRQGRLIA